MLRRRPALFTAEKNAFSPTLLLMVDGVDPELRELFAWAVREGVTNVVRHARASHCRVTLSATSIEIADDGVGLGPPGAAAAGHGLEGLRRRCQDNGADLAFESPPGGGAVLRVNAHRPSPRPTRDATG